MKKLVNEVITILLLILAMYLISTAGINEQTGLAEQNKKHTNNTSESQQATLNKEYQLADTRIKKLKKAKESLGLYRLYKGEKLIEPVAVVIDGRSIDINTANAYQLTFLRGIGKALSKRIIEYRIENGIFYNIEDLVKVKGIGKKKLAKILNQ